MFNVRARRWNSALPAVFLSVLTTFATLATSAPAANATTRTFYVDCAAANDNSAGTSPSTAWKSVAKANMADLTSGDSLLFKRGCTWSGTALRASWIGIAAAPITVASYGTSDAAPYIADASIVVTGQYEVIDGFRVSFKPVATDPCGQPLGTYYALVITRGGSHNLVRNNLLTHATAGIHISATAGSKNIITHNTLAANNVMQVPFDGKGDLGAWGMLVRGSDNDISYNTFRDNIAVCNKGTYVASNSIEIFEGDRNRIHHNRSYNDRVFSELGSSATNKAQDNSYAFNLHTSATPGARFITTRGGKDLNYGPVWRTTADRNTIYYTGAGSQGLVCSLGCSSDILNARYNVIDVVEKTIYHDATMGQSQNLLWSTGTVVKIEDGANNMRTLVPGSYAAFIVADPAFVNPGSNDLRVRSWSPAIDGGGTTAYATDLQDKPASNGPADIGGFEYYA